MYVYGFFFELSYLIPIFIHSYSLLSYSLLLYFNKPLWITDPVLRTEWNENNRTVNSQKSKG